MNSWLLLLMIPLGAAALGSLFDSNDDDNDDEGIDEPDAQPGGPGDGTTGDDTLSAPEGYRGRVMGHEGDDQITVTSPEDPARYIDRSVLESDDGYWANWPNWVPDSTGGVPPGVVMPSGGDGDDTIIAEGRGIYADGGTGDDRIELDSITEDTTDREFGYFSSVADGGAGDDEIVVSGRYAVVQGDAGDDNITASGNNMLINGGEGADTIDVTGLTNSAIAVEAGDVVTGRGDGADGLHFFVNNGGDFTGNNANEQFVVRNSSRVDGGAGNDTMSTYFGDEGSSTLIGGAGDDYIRGNDGVVYYASTQRDEYSMHIGNSNDLLDGGDGDDLIGFDLADTVTGGAGADALVGYVDSNQTSVVTDFTAGEDVLTINVDPEDIGSETSYENVAIDEVDGNTVISINGIESLRIEGATGLNIGFKHEGQYVNDEVDTDYWTDADGNVVDPATLDVRIDIFEEFPT